MTLRALLFDVDGTLADTEEVHRRAFNLAFRDHGLAIEWNEELYEQLLAVPGGKERLAHHVATARLDVARSTLEAVHKTKTEHYTALVAAGDVPLRPGVKRIFEEARAAGLALGIATTTTEANVRALFRATLGDHALDGFAVLACGDVVRAKKPAPDVYLHALRVLGLGPEEAVAFEDSGPGLAAAKAAGLFTVVTPCPWTRAHDTSAADIRVAHLGDHDSPLTGDDAARAGGPMLTLERIRHEAIERRQ